MLAVPSDRNLLSAPLALSPVHQLPLATSLSTVASLPAFLAAATICYSVVSSPALAISPTFFSYCVGALFFLRFLSRPRPRFRLVGGFVG